MMTQSGYKLVKDST